MSGRGSGPGSGRPSLADDDAFLDPSSSGRGDGVAASSGGAPHGPGAGPRWRIVRVRSPRAASDDELGALLAATLLELGGSAVQEDDRGWVTHLAPDRDPGTAAQVAATLRGETGLKDLEIHLDWQDDADWTELWKAGLEPRRVTPRLVLTPSWKSPELRPGDLCITLDPGMAFGNAEHGTTRGCLRLMDGVVAEGDRVLDVGAGSAVLSIAAALLGAERVEALEADEQAVPTARVNVARNGVEDRVTVEEATATAASLAARARAAAREGRPHDRVLANIETFLLEPLLPGLAAATRPGGTVILSGILAEEWEDFRPRVEAHGLRCEAVDEDGIWVSARFRAEVHRSTR